MRIGHGYDAHRFGKQRPFVIGGVKISCTHGICAHSDGDTLAHAVIDALLGAAGMPDIGSLYPDSDPAYEGIDSMGLLSDAARRVTDAGFRIDYIDCTIVAQVPKMKAHIPMMRQHIADACGIKAERVNVKATTEEHMGFTGEEIGLAAHAVCLLQE